MKPSAAARIILVACSTVVLAEAAPAQAQDGGPAVVAAPATEGRAGVTVGVKIAPPFAYKLQDGSWSGLSIELWKRVADQTGLPYRLVEVSSVQDQIQGVATGRFDLATAAITVTAEREKAVDFTQPFYASGLGIAVPISAGPSWQPILRSLTSFGFLQAVLALVGISLLVGILIWLFERRHNADFGGGAFQGLFSSFWWSTIAATQASTGDFGPRTFPGRVLAVVWMMGSIIALAVFTAGVTSVLTVKQMEGLVQNEKDLASVRVGDVRGSSTSAYLDATHVRHQGYASIRDGLEALKAGKVDALVYDRPLLSWFVNQDYASTIQVLDVTFETQNYAMALRNGSDLRETLDVALLETLNTDWWKQMTFQALGEK